jgi:hypothetical protein
MTIQRNLGLLLTGIWLILMGIAPLIRLDLGIVPAILALVAGILLVLAR